VGRVGDAMTGSFGRGRRTDRSWKLRSARAEKLWWQGKPDGKPSGFSFLALDAVLQSARSDPVLVS
jgi:hypothetical protein